MPGLPGRPRRTRTRTRALPLRPAMFVIFVAAAVGFSAGFIWTRLRTDDSPRHPNLLFVSICSLRQDRLGAYGYPRDTTPNLDRFARNAWVFQNGIGTSSWRKPGRYLLSVPNRDFVEQGYQGYGTKVELPGTPFSVEMAAEDFQGDAQNFQEILNSVKARLLASKREAKPFVMSVHFKQLHFPYLGVNRQEFDFGRYLSPASRELLARYEMLAAAPNPPRELIPLFTLLFGEDSAEGPSAAGLVSDEALLAQWRASPDYAAGVNLASEIYDARLRHVDAALHELLELWGDEELRRRTVVIAGGDHGTALMDHGYLIHGQTVYDEGLRFPLLIHFPGQRGRRDFAGQISPRSIVDLTSALMRDGRSSRAPQVFDEVTDSAIYSRNCSRTILSLRLENAWKFILNLATGERELYDLAADPRERQNVIELHGDMAAQLEETMNRELPQLETGAFRQGATCTEGS